MSRKLDLDDAVELVAAEMVPHLGRGKVADYIPALARIDPRRFGLAVATLDGRIATAGDARAAFSIQSISKVFTLTLALEQVGETLWRRVGREPSGSAYNSIVQLERERGVPRNPLINPGAMVVCDVLLAGGTPAALIERITQFLQSCAHDLEVDIDQEVAASEAATGFRNASLANFLAAFGNLKNPVADVLNAYFHQCALALSCAQLARAGLFLANCGVDPVSGARVTSPLRARRINAVMMSCGHYDASGDFAFRVGLPGKSGVGGGILAVAPGHGAAAVWSPGLNPEGTSVVGMLALQRLSDLLGWSVF